MSYKYGIVLDLDDTVICTSYVYYLTYARVLKAIYEDVAPKFLQPSEIYDIYKMFNYGEYFDDKRIAAVGITNLPTEDLFPRVMVETYCEVCVRCGVIPNNKTAAEIQDLAYEIYRHNYRMAPGAMKLLNYLVKCKDVTLFMLTKGSNELQLPKIRSKKIFQHFEKIMLCPMTGNKGDYLKKLKEDYEDIDAWLMVGDSIPSDINPALGNGYIAIHITDGMSHIAEGEVITVGSAKDNYKVFENLEQFMDFFQAAKKEEANAEA